MKLFVEPFYNAKAFQKLEIKDNKIIIHVFCGHQYDNYYAYKNVTDFIGIILDKPLTEGPNLLF